MAGTGLTPAPPLRAGLSFASYPFMGAMLGVWACGAIRVAVPVSRDIVRGASDITAPSNAAGSSFDWKTHRRAKPRSDDVAGRAA